MANTTRTTKQARKAASSPIQRNLTAGDDILHFEIKRSHFWGLIAPVAFSLGLLVGFLVWGRAPLAAAATTGTAANPVVQNPVQQNPTGATDIGTQIAGLQRYEIPIEPNDPILGPVDAPITIVEFADFQCPYCVRHFEQTYPLIAAQYGDQVRFVYKNFPLTSIHPDADPAAQAAECAHEQGMFWEFHDLLFGGTLGLGQAAYAAYAEQLGLDVAALTACLEEGRYASAVDQDLALGQQLGVSSTPTFFINGIALVGAYPFDTFASIIDYELEASGQ
ncbi:MAG: DsbA family protein [Anaerolineales bacterium]|nr:DsbA family protein [Anaerolineales bacterium]